MGGVDIAVRCLIQDRRGVRLAWQFGSGCPAGPRSTVLPISPKAARLTMGGDKTPASGDTTSPIPGETGLCHCRHCRRHKIRSPGVEKPSSPIGCPMSLTQPDRSPNQAEDEHREGCL